MNKNVYARTVFIIHRNGVSKVRDGIVRNSKIDIFSSITGLFRPPGNYQYYSLWNRKTPKIDTWVRVWSHFNEV